MENKIHGYIYLITNLINNKQYIGQTVRTIKKRFNGHCGSKNSVISKAIRKYGKENFIVQELAIAYNQEKLTFLEGMYIAWFDTLSPNGYNITNIIKGKEKLSEETRQKLKIAQNTPEKLKWASENGKKHRGKIVKNSKSKYIGIYFRNKKYICSTIMLNNKRLELGRYNTEIDAAKAYDIAAIKYFGYDCNLNFPELRQDYIDGKINIKRNKKESKSGIKNIYFIKNRNVWQIKYFDKKLNKYKYKHFKTIDEATMFKTSL